ncbi:hypothetical protein OH77DRAFT_859055 [Trametes cingulata]|nr:hypothetical protein OH77DRAFT_859055 [Trametes cingulata]
MCQCVILVPPATSPSTEAFPTPHMQSIVLPGFLSAPAAGVLKHLRDRPPARRQGRQHAAASSSTHRTPPNVEHVSIPAQTIGHVQYSTSRAAASDATMHLTRTIHAQAYLTLLPTRPIAS